MDAVQSHILLPVSIVRSGPDYSILDPLLARLLSSNVDVDYNVTVHQLRNIETLFKMGGQSLSRVCQISEVAKSTHPMLPNKAALFPNAVTYLDLVTDVLLGWVIIIRC